MRIFPEFLGWECCIMTKKNCRITASIMLLSIIFSLLAGCGHKHEYGAWTVESPATCTSKGKKVCRCSCGAERSLSISKKKHKYESQITRDADCSGNGILTYACTGCTDSYTEEIESKKYTATELFDMCKDSVGEIVVFNEKGEELGLGSCFVHKPGELITNYHVIEDSCAAEVTIANKVLKVEKVLAYDKNVDVAILQVDDDALTPLPLCRKEHVVGSEVYALGNSRGLTSTFSDGMITTASREVADVNYIQHDAPISGGNSGGPLINIYGEVIGINTWTFVDSQNLNFAIALSELDNVQYGKALTMKEFYENECSPFHKLKNYIVEEGTYDDGTYSLDISKQYSSDYSSTYYYWAAYDVSDDVIEFYFNLDMEIGQTVKIDNTLSGEYLWILIDNNDDYIGGYVEAEKYTSYTNLQYAETTFVNDISAYLDLAEAMLCAMLLTMDDYLADSTVTVADLGFTNF